MNNNRRELRRLPVNNNPGNPAEVTETAIVVWRPPRHCRVERIPVVVTAFCRWQPSRQQVPMFAMNNPTVTETAVVPWRPNRFSWRIPVATMAVNEPAAVMQGPQPAPIVQGPPRGPPISYIVRQPVLDCLSPAITSTRNKPAVANNNRAIVLWHPPLLNATEARQVVAPTGTTLEPDQAVPPVPPPLSRVAAATGTTVHWSPSKQSSLCDAHPFKTSPESF